MSSCKALLEKQIIKPPCGKVANKNIFVSYQEKLLKLVKTPLCYGKFCQPKFIVSCNRILVNKDSTSKLVT